VEDARMKLRLSENVLDVTLPNLSMLSERIVALIDYMEGCLDISD
jgi:hypothetical protein